MLAEIKKLHLVTIQLPTIFKFASVLQKLSDSITMAGQMTNNGQSINSNASILLADDDIDDREFFEDIIKEIHPNINFNSVADGNELMKVLTACNGILPDLLFLDLNMPGKNGKQCLEEIRSNTQLKNLPVIIYSTSSLAQDIADTYSIGANLYFRKPNSFRGALISLQKILAMDFENLAAKPDRGSYTIFPDKL